MSNFVNNINRITDLTKLKKISWKAEYSGNENESTYIWETTDSANNRINVLLFPQDEDTIFRIWDYKNKQPITDISNRKIDMETRVAINALYKTVKNQFIDGNTDILSDLINKVK